MSRYRYPRYQWCELHHGPAIDVRAVMIGPHADERDTVMICPECVKELYRDLGWIYPADSFKWDYIFPNAARYHELVRFLRSA